ncbi:MAG: AmmeMemoRadiSam system radical SAM enzyme [Candidatus Omnitrophica bacterium]|nr:AmmeMemoRadiSam system radical SAM enzyme [Candidatus Omnitrophota bacterium]
MQHVECLLCPRHCRIPEGGRGDCRVRANVDGKLFSLVYGKPCAVHVDPIEKKPFFHVLPTSTSFSIATAGCNLHCKGCQNWTISQRPPEETDNLDLPPEAVVREALRAGCRSIAYTYSDPVIFYEYTFDTSVLARQAGLLNLLHTAGYIEKAPLADLCPELHAANVDIKGMTDDFYHRMSRGTLQPVLDCVLALKKAGIWVEITNLVVPTWNDRDEDIRALARWVRTYAGKDVPVHFSRFWPMHELTNLPPTPEDTLARARKIAMAEGLQYVYIGNIQSGNGNNTYCPDDGQLLIARDGYEVTENHLVDGKCERCGTAIPGIWK